ncbi:hypothetical protein [Azospirillum sp. INR13]|uniref:oxidoreductase n=1 Tax=Azospirillum sp. INR13 TaxID=2596919 RepID=UPI00351C8554
MKSCGAVPGIQLMHAGRKARQRFPWDGRGALPRSPEIADWDEWDVVAPSAIPQDDGYPMPREMTPQDIDDCVEAWGTAAARADRAGYEVMELHAAHGYLIHEFLSPASNRRTDRYGGSFENRIRFAVEVVERVRASWPEHKPLILRVSTEDDGGWEVDDSVALARILKPLGVDAFDCSSGGISGASPIETRISLAYGYQVGFAERVRREADLPTMAVGLIIHADQAEAIVRDGCADLVAIARELLYNPNWPIDAAQKLGIDARFALAPVQHGHFLHRRSVSGFTGSLSTWTAGMSADANLS